MPLPVPVPPPKKTERAQAEVKKGQEKKKNVIAATDTDDNGDGEDTDVSPSVPAARAAPAAVTISLDATDEEVHALSLRCRLSDAESQVAQLEGLAQAGHWYAELCYARLCSIGAPFVTKDPAPLKTYLDKNPTTLLLAKAEDNNRYAQFALGFVYSEEGVLYDAAGAVKYNLLAAEQGHPIAQRYLYLFYLKGHHGLAVDENEAMKWLRMSSEQDYAAAQYNLASNYMKGKCGLAKDAVEAVRLFKLAAKQGYVDAEFSLAQAYSKGEGGLKKSDVNAVKYYERAAGQGHAAAQFCLANAYAKNSEGIKKKQLSDQEREAIASAVYRDAAEQGHVKSMVKVGHHFLKLKEFSDTCIEWSQRGGESKKKIDKMIREAADEEKQAIDWFLRAAKEGNAEGQYYAGIASRNLDEKLRWLRLAADQEYADAYFQLGHCYQHGVGVAVSVEEASKWYKMKVDDEIANGESGKGAAADCIKAMNKKGGLFGFMR